MLLFCKKVIRFGSRPLKKPELTAKQVKEKAKETGAPEILAYMNRNVKDGDQMHTRVPDSIHQLLKTSHYNMNRQINRLKAWIL